MTVTATAVSEHEVPAPATLKAETYWWHLAALRECATRDSAASRVLSLASAAGQIAAALAGTPEAAPDTDRDPLAWTDIATYLTRLALALLGGQMRPDERWQDNDGDSMEWGDLAVAVTRREFAAAWHSIREILAELAAPRDDDGPRLRAFTVAQVTRAAAAVIDAPW